MSARKRIETKYKQADRALDRNDPHKAVCLLKELVASEPGEPLFHWRLGYALSEMEQYHSAIAAFRKALKLDRGNVPALGGLGRAYMELREWKRAEKAFRARLALKKSPQHYVFLAYILMKMARYDLAAECCRKAIELDPSFAEAYLNLGLALQRKKRFEEAIGAFESAVRLDDKDAVGFRELGLTYYSLGRFDLAKKALDISLSLNRRDPWCHLYLALCLQDMGDFRAAARHFKAARASDPKNRFFKKKHEEFLRWISKGGNGNAARLDSRNRPRAWIRTNGP
jgi:tetratricopeptide (TPR) repeat protein